MGLLEKGIWDRIAAFGNAMRSAMDVIIVAIIILATLFIWITDKAK